MDKHTPGPWFIDTPWSGFSAIRAADRSIVFALAHATGDEYVPSSACEANARLIAAAPDMLAALEEADERLHAIGDYSNWPARAKVRAAIAKARGL